MFATDSFWVGAIREEMVAIPGGKFLMGTEDQEIERLVKKFFVSFKSSSKYIESELIHIRRKVT